MAAHTLIVALLSFHARPLFRPVTRTTNVAATALSLGSVGGPNLVASAATPLKVLFDSSCAVCLTNKAVLTALDRKRSKLEFVDILAFPGTGYVAPNGEIITKDEAMRHIHVIGPGTQVIACRRKAAGTAPHA